MFLMTETLNQKHKESHVQTNCHHQGLDWLKASSLSEALAESFLWDSHLSLVFAF